MAAIILLFGFRLFLIRRLFVKTLLRSVHLALGLFIGITVIGTRMRCKYSMRKLRVVELLIFGFPAFILAEDQFAYMLQEAQRGDTTMTLAVTKSSVIYFLALSLLTTYLFRIRGNAQQ